MTESDYRKIALDGVKYYGKHVLVTACGCNDSILDEAAMRCLLDRMVSVVGAVAFGEPLVARFGEGSDVGISAVQLISASAVMLHTNDAARDMYLDVFSCIGFDEREVLAVVREILEPAALTSQVLLRG